MTETLSRPYDHRDRKMLENRSTAETNLHLLTSQAYQVVHLMCNDDKRSVETITKDLAQGGLTVSEIDTFIETIKNILLRYPSMQQIQEMERKMREKK